MSSSEDEAPEQVTFKSAKTAVEKERHLVNLQKQNRKKVEKLRRRLRQETYLVQKQEKVAKRRQREREQLFSSSDVLEELRAEMSLSNPNPPPEIKETESTATEGKLKIGSSNPKKIYPDLNIEVRTLSGLKTDRGASAAAFREKRLSKLHRESAGLHLIHKEKLIAAGKL